MLRFINDNIRVRKVSLLLINFVWLLFVFAALEIVISGGSPFSADVSVPIISQLLSFFLFILAFALGGLDADIPKGSEYPSVFLLLVTLTVSFLCFLWPIYKCTLYFLGQKTIEEAEQAAKIPVIIPMLIMGVVIVFYMFISLLS